MICELTKTEVGQASHVGLVRALNEDTLLTLELRLGRSPAGISFGLYAVADGVGGHEAGEIASNLALRMLAESIVKSLLLPRLRPEMHSLFQESTLQILAEGVEAANNEVYSQAQAKGNNMGTTLAAVLIVDTTVYIANVGDSRIYLLEGAQLRQVTTDHSLVASLVAAGEITSKAIYTHPQRNIVTRCLGMRQDIEVDIFVEELKPGDSLLACSDGLWEMVRDDKINEVLLQSSSPQLACEQLVELSNRNGGVDNVSVIVAKVVGLEAQHGYFR